jgi:basic membrane protein A
MGAPSACEAAGVPNVSYNGSTVAACPNTFIVSSRINWAPYYKYMIECVQKGEAIAVDWCGGIEEGSVVLTDINDKAAAAGTADAIKTATEGLKNGTVNVFDTANFTVGNVKLESHKVEEKEVIENGIFKESKIMAAPYFDLRIDGITLLNEKY